MVFLAVDPGLDLVAAAVFDTALARPGSIDGALKGWVGMETTTTNKTLSNADRCAAIGGWIAGLVTLTGAELLVIEEPAKSGTYARNAGLAAAVADGLAKLNRGIGAVVVGASQAGARVVELPANRLKKEQRHRMLEVSAKRAKIELPKGPRGGKKPDEMDALWIGTEYINNNRT